MSAVLKPVFALHAMAEADLPVVLAIENAIYAFPWTLGNFRDSLAAAYSCWTYLRDCELIGYAVLMRAADEAHLLNLSIDAQRQRRGHGSQLLRLVCERARASGAQRLLLEVRPSNLAALRLYRRHGFQLVGLRRGYYPAVGGREDALIYSLPL